MARLAYSVNWNATQSFSIHQLYEPVLRCSAEASGFTWGSFTGCFDEFGACIADNSTGGCYETWSSPYPTVGVAATAAYFGVPMTTLNHSLSVPGSTNPLTFADFDVTGAQLGAFVA